MIKQSKVSEDSELLNQVIKDVTEDLGYYNTIEIHRRYRKYREQDREQDKYETLEAKQNQDN